jgi:hypothetical protein
VEHLLGLPTVCVGLAFFPECTNTDTDVFSKTGGLLFVADWCCQRW